MKPWHEHDAELMGLIRDGLPLEQAYDWCEREAIIAEACPTE